VDVELPLAAGYRLGVDPATAQLGRETRSPFVVARSGGAVENPNVHDPILFGVEVRDCRAQLVALLFVGRECVHQAALAFVREP
jgi:hypothetical protein